MKVRRDGGWRWKPFDVVLTIESEEEARALYAIFNYSHNVDILPEEAGDNIRKAIGKRYGDLNGSQLIARGVHYGVFYKSKRED